MLPKKFPQSILQSSFDLLQVGQTQDYEGQVPLARLERLAGMVLESDDVFSVKLTLGRDEARYPYIKGQITGKVSVNCQRCMDVMTIEINSQFCLSPVSSSVRSSLPERYEPVELENDKLDVYGVVAEEVLLSLPMIPMHAIDACQGQQWLRDNKVEAEAFIGETVVKNPFEILKTIK